MNVRFLSLEWPKLSRRLAGNGGGMFEEKLLLSVLKHGEPKDIPPIWLMRQAGRYLPEYRDIRSKAASFLDFCYTPAAAAEATLQPIRRFHFDAAILFSDILVVPDAMGQKVSFESGEGPRLDPISEPGDLSRLIKNFDLDRLSPVFEAIDRVKGELPRDVAFIGFCGAPWTVASYMVAGRGTSDQAPARLFAFRYPEAFEQLMERLVDASTQYLLRQIEAGVEVVQIFDSWAGVLPAREFEKWVLAPVGRIISALREKRPEIPVIAFIRNAGTHLAQLSDRLGAQCLGLDTSVDASWAIAQTKKRMALQGNLDPLALVVGGAALDREVEAILQAFEGYPHIFNLGHGILPDTPIEHVERLVARVRRERL
jgi:uroporphyrinogen decarboxylase